MHRILVVIVLSLAWPAIAHADEAPMRPEAKAKYDKGIAHYAAKEYEAAASELRAAYFLETRREILFAWAQAERLSNDCASAIPLYRKYLASDPPANTAATAKGHMDKCIEQVGPGGEARDPTLPAEPEPAKPAVVAPRPEQPATITRRKPFYKDTVGDALAITGVVVLGVGGTFFYMSMQSKDEAADAPTYAEYQDAIDTGITRRRIAIGALAAGGVLVTGAIVRWAIHGGGTETVPAVGLGITPGGATVGVSGQF